MSPESPRVVIAAGGTGGHMFPAQALAEVLLARGRRVTLSTDARGARYTQGFPESVTVEQVASATFARGGPLAKLGVPFRILGGIRATTRAFRMDRPQAVIGFGGYPSIPALAAAWRLGLPRMIHEQNGVLGRVNTHLASRVDEVACGTWPTQLPQGVTGVHTGNPVRRAILDAAATAYAPPGDGTRLHLVILGGSQGARALSDHLPPALAALRETLRARLHLSHQARPEDQARVTQSYRDAGIDAEVAPFFHDVPERLAQAQLAVCRAGASTIADLTVIGRPSILIPYPYAASDHQSANATGLSQAGASVVLKESQLQQAMLTNAIAEILSDPQKAQSMAQAAKELGRPSAATHLADLVEDLGKGHKA